MNDMKEQKWFYSIFILISTLFMHYLDMKSLFSFFKKKKIYRFSIICLKYHFEFDSCLHDKVYIFGRIFVKLSQFFYLINSSNPIDFEKNWTISKWKVAI